MQFAESRSHRRARALLLAGAGMLLCASIGGCAMLSRTPDRAAPPGEAAGAQRGSAAANGPSTPVHEGSGTDAASAGAKGAPAPDALSPVVVHDFDAALQALHDGRAQDAERAFQALARSNPELGGPHANLGIIYQHADKIDQAVTELELAVHGNPQQPVYWNQLGIAYRRQGQFAKAREAYEKAIALDPDYPAPNLNLGILFDLYLWDSKRALELYDRYLVLSPGGDEQVHKWVADLKNRDREQRALSGKEQQ